MFCPKLTLCFGGNPASDHPEAGGVAPAPCPPEVAGNSIQRSKPYQDLSYEVVPGGVSGNWTECQLGETLPADVEPVPTEGVNGERRSLLDRFRKMCSLEKTPEELEIEMLRKERKELLKTLKGFGIDDRRLKPANLKNIRADVDQAILKELRKLEEQQPSIEMQEIKSCAVSESVPIPPTLETNVDDVLPPLKGSPSVDYPLTQLDPVGDGGPPRGEKILSWKLATPIALPDIE